MVKSNFFKQTKLQSPHDTSTKSRAFNEEKLKRDQDDSLFHVFENTVLIGPLYHI